MMLTRRSKRAPACCDMAECYHSEFLQARVTTGAAPHGVPMIAPRGVPVPIDRRLRPSIYLEVDDGVSVLVDTSIDSDSRR
jgi:hypothetical protein